MVPLGLQLMTLEWSSKLWCHLRSWWWWWYVYSTGREY